MDRRMVALELDQDRKARPAPSGSPPRNQAQARIQDCLEFDRGPSKLGTSLPALEDHPMPTQLASSLEVALLTPRRITVKHQE